jgi:hypothetical protein
VAPAESCQQEGIFRVSRQRVTLTAARKEKDTTRPCCPGPRRGFSPARPSCM